MKQAAIAFGVVLCALGSLPAHSAEPTDFCHVVWKTDCASALKQFQTGAEKGDPSAMINIAAMYRNGNGVPKDDTASFGWHMRAAQTGNSMAQTLVAEDYTKGYGVAVNYVAGARWYRSAAAGGNTDAMNGLAKLYATGRGLPQSNVEALKWYLRAEGASAPAFPPFREASAAIAKLVKRMTPNEIAQAKK